MAHVKKYIFLCFFGPKCDVGGQGHPRREYAGMARCAATTRPQGWCRTGPGVVKWPYVCDLKCECGRSGIFNVISCGAVNYVRTPARRARGSWVEAGWKLARPQNAWKLNGLSWKLVEAPALPMALSSALVQAPHPLVDQVACG